MSDNMALLSQEEIDTLLDFLTQQKSRVGNEVMDQESIDRLISLLHTDKVRSIKFDTAVPEARRERVSALILLGGISDIREQQQNCLLDCSQDEKTGYVRIFCRDIRNDKRYYITPKCMEQMRYIEGDKSEWGFAVPPLTFDKLSVLLSVKYTKSSFNQITRIFSEKMFGQESIPVPDLYMPTAYSLIHHLNS